MRTVILLLMVGLGVSLAGAQTGWLSAQPGQSSQLYSVHFVDTTFGWIAGLNGLISASTDGGQNWTRQTAVTGLAFYSVHFVDRNHGWAVGDTIFYTTDGGVHWSTQGVGARKVLSSVHFIDANIGWAVGAGGAVYHTTNGGANWTPQTSNTSQYLYCVYFTDANHGWATGWSGTILRTTNGGDVWIAETRPLTGQLNSVHFIDADNGWIVGLSTILHTTNGGILWNAQTLPSGPPAPDPNFYCVQFVDANNGWITGGSGGVLNTTDGGAHWTLQALVGASINRSICMVDAKYGWLVGGYYVYYTKTGGVVVSVDEPRINETPHQYSLSQNYPNPFNPSTTIRYGLPQKSHVTVIVFNTLGQEVTTLAQGERKAGYHEVQFNASGLSSGVYFCQMRAGDYVATMKLLLVR